MRTNIMPPLNLLTVIDEYYNRNNVRPSIEELKILSDIQVTRNGRNVLRASKPKDPCSAYVWRMVAFMASPIRAHQCMPVTADWDIPGKYDERRAVTKELDKLVDAVTAVLPINSRCAAWGRALGYM